MAIKLTMAQQLVIRLREAGLELRETEQLEPNPKGCISNDHVLWRCSGKYKGGAKEIIFECHYTIAECARYGVTIDLEAREIHSNQGLSGKPTNNNRGRHAVGA